MPPAVDRPLIRLRSPFARAVVPVLGGIGFFILLGLATWGVAAWISRGGAETSERFVPSRLPMGNVYDAAEEVAERGPILLPGLNTTSGERSLVVHHEGQDPTRGWQIFYAFPAGRDHSCHVEQIIGTRQFVDCDGSTIDVLDLAPPDDGVYPIVENQRVLYLDLSGITR